MLRFRPGKWTPAAAARRKLLARRISADTVVFHNYAGMTMLVGVIPHRRSVLYLHTNSADVFELLPHRIQFLDAFVASGGGLADELKKIPACTVPVTPLEYPLGESFFNAAAPEKSGGLVLGFSGRLDDVQKKAGRLVGLCAQLAARGVCYRLEIAGTARWKRRCGGSSPAGRSSSWRAGRAGDKRVLCRLGFARLHQRLRDRHSWRSRRWRPAHCLSCRTFPARRRNCCGQTIFRSIPKATWRRRRP